MRRKRKKKYDQPKWAEWTQLAVRAALIVIDWLVNKNGFR